MHNRDSSVTGQLRKDPRKDPLSEHAFLKAAAEADDFWPARRDRGEQSEGEAWGTCP